MSRRSDVERLLEAQGWVIETRGRRHARATHPDAPGARIWFASTPGDWRAQRNAIALARRTLRHAGVRP